jgi:hypothetical protein
MPLTTTDISIQLLMDTTNTLQDIESSMTARAFGAVHNRGSASSSGHRGPGPATNGRCLRSNPVFARKLRMVASSR